MPNVFNVNSVRSRRYTWQRTATVYIILFRLPLSHLVAKYHPRRDPTLFYAHDSPSLRIEVQLLPRVLLPGRQFVADSKIREHAVTVPIEHIGTPLYKRPFDLCVIFSAPIQGAPQPWNSFWVAPILEIIRYFAVLAEKGLETFGRVGVHAHSPNPLPIKSYVCEPVLRESWSACSQPQSSSNQVICVRASSSQEGRPISIHDQKCEIPLACSLYCTSTGSSPSTEILSPVYVCSQRNIGFWRGKVCMERILIFPHMAED